MKFLGVQAAKKCTAPNRCEEREKRWAFAKWWFDVKCMHLMTLLSLCPWIFARLQPHKLWCTMIILTKHDGSHDSVVHIIACPRTTKVTKDWCDPTRFHHFGPKTLRKRGKHGSVFQQILSQMISRNHGCFTGKSLSNSKSWQKSHPRNRSDLQWAIPNGFGMDKISSPRGPKSLSVKICLVDPFKNHRTHLFLGTQNFQGIPRWFHPFQSGHRKSTDIHRLIIARSSDSGYLVFGFWLSGELNTNQKMKKKIF